MALIYSTVTQSGSIVSVHFADYIRKLIDQIIRSGEDRKGTITATLDLDPVAFGIDTATPCGLIVNELVTNALQHTFPLIGGEVRVQLRGVGDGTYQLAVIDNGVGFPSPQDWQVPRCLGLQLVATLVEQLDGVLESATNGDQTSVTIRFREVRYQTRY
jgi:two-component sensor histidine kinase